MEVYNSCSYVTIQHNADRLLKLIENVYRWLPLGTIINNRVLVVHGGISDTTDLDLIKSLDRGKVSEIKVIFTVSSTITAGKENVHTEKWTFAENVNSYVYTLKLTYIYQILSTTLN